MKKITILILTTIFFLPLSSSAFDAFVKEDINAVNLLKQKNIPSELSSVSLSKLAVERRESANLIEIGNYKFFSTLITDNNWELYFAIWPENSSMDNKTLWLGAELEKGVVYEYQGIKFNIVLENGNITIAYDESENKFISKISYDDIFLKLYFNAEKIIFADRVEYAIIRNHDPLNDKDGIIALRRDREGMFWYSFNLDDIISNQIKWLVGINGVLYGMRVCSENLVFFSKIVDMDKKIYGKEKLLNYPVTRSRSVFY